MKYPAIKLARLAVDKRFQHEGIGKRLMKEFFMHAFRLAMEEGGRFITVDAKRNALGFYLKFGFKNVGRTTNQDILPLYLEFKWYCETSIENESQKLV